MCVVEFSPVTGWTYDWKLRSDVSLRKESVGDIDRKRMVTRTTQC